MKRIHLILLIAAAITALSSVYSLAAMNQTYKITFEWFSEYKECFTSEKRDASRDKWQLEDIPPETVLTVITDALTLDTEMAKSRPAGKKPVSVNFEHDLIIFSSIGVVASPEYRIKVTDIAQRGDVVEVLVSMNSPIKPGDSQVPATHTYEPFDLIKVKKTSFPIKGKLLFVFKNQDGTTLKEQYCEVG